MKKIALLFLNGISLGLGIGLCLAGLVGVVYRETQSGPPGLHPGAGTAYFWVVGGLMGFFGGWCFFLQMMLGNLLVSLFVKVADLIPLPAQVVGAEWAKKMEIFFREIIQPFPGFFRKFIEWIFILRFEDYGRINRALEKAKKKGGTQADDPSMDVDGDSSLSLGAALAPLLHGLCYPFADQLCFLELSVFSSERTGLLGDANYEKWKLLQSHWDDDEYLKSLTPLMKLRYKRLDEKIEAILDQNFHETGAIKEPAASA